MTHSLHAKTTHQDFHLSILNKTPTGCNSEFELKETNHGTN